MEDKIAAQLSWADVTRLVAGEICKILGKQIRCTAFPDDSSYWAVQFEGYAMPLSEVWRLLEVTEGTEDDRRDSLPEDNSVTVKSIGKDLSTRLLNNAMGYQWEAELIAEDTLWLLGEKKSQPERKIIFALNNLNIDLNSLKSRQELISYFNENGPTHSALMDFCEDYRNKYHNELCWPYPISDGKHLGTFLVLVREGVLSLPYDDADKVDYELFCMDDICMLDAASMGEFMESWRLFDDELWAAMEALKGCLLHQEEYCNAK